MYRVLRSLTTKRISFTTSNAIYNVPNFSTGEGDYTEAGLVNLSSCVCAGYPEVESTHNQPPRGTLLPQRVPGCHSCRCSHSNVPFGQNGLRMAQSAQNCLANFSDGEHSNIYFCRLVYTLAFNLVLYMCSCLLHTETRRQYSSCNYWEKSRHLQHRNFGILFPGKLCF